jgi:hypothetical protein
MLSELHNLNLKLCNKQYNKKFVLHLIVAPQLSSGWGHYYSTKTRLADRTSEQSMYSLMSMALPLFRCFDGKFGGKKLNILAGKKSDMFG